MILEVKDEHLEKQKRRRWLEKKRLKRGINIRYGCGDDYELFTDGGDSDHGGNKIKFDDIGPRSADIFLVGIKAKYKLTPSIHQKTRNTQHRQGGGVLCRADAAQKRNVMHYVLCRYISIAQAWAKPPSKVHYPQPLCVCVRTVQQLANNP